MPFACIRKRVDGEKAYCGEDIPKNHHAFTHAERAVAYYDKSVVRNPNPTMLWCCPACVTAVKKEIEEHEKKGDPF